MKFSHFGWGYLTSNGSGGTDKQSDLHVFYDLSSSIDKVSFKSNSMSLGHVLLEEKIFMHTHTQTPQSDAIMSADIKNKRLSYTVNQMNSLPISCLALSQRVTMFVSQIFTVEVFVILYMFYSK